MWVLIPTAPRVAAKPLLPVVVAVPVLSDFPNSPEPIHHTLCYCMY
jgi:hypothetical protein